MPTRAAVRWLKVRTGVYRSALGEITRTGRKWSWKPVSGITRCGYRTFSMAKFDASIESGR